MIGSGGFAIKVLVLCSNIEYKTIDHYIKTLHINRCLTYKGSAINSPETNSSIVNAPETNGSIVKAAALFICFLPLVFLF